MIPADELICGLMGSKPRASGDDPSVESQAGTVFR